jgi:hypothetical protein
VRRWLPAGRAGGLTCGALLLVVAGTRLEPLRRGNPDFDLVGPGWVAVAAFTVLVVFHGMLVAALAGRVSRAVPLLAARPGPSPSMPRLLLLVLPGPSLALVLVIVGVVVVLGSRIPSVVAALHARRSVTIGRVALALVALVTFPGFASDLVDILGRPSARSTGPGTTTLLIVRELPRAPTGGVGARGRVPCAYRELMVR